MNMKAYRTKETGMRGVIIPNTNHIRYFSGATAHIGGCEELHDLDALIPRGFLGHPGTKLKSRYGNGHLTVVEVGLNTVILQGPNGSTNTYSFDKIKEDFTLADEPETQAEAYSPQEGDYVRIKHFDERPSNWDDKGRMDRLMGKVLKIDFSEPSSMDCFRTEQIPGQKETRWFFKGDQIIPATKDDYDKCWNFGKYAEPVKITKENYKDYIEKEVWKYNGEPTVLCGYSKKWNHWLCEEGNCSICLSMYATDPTEWLKQQGENDHI